MSGYVRIHRSLFQDHPAFRNDAEATAFAWLIARAQWRPKCVRYKERKLTLERGQLAISQRDMARALDRDKAWVERLWRRLRDEAMITVAVEAGVAVITICNYGNYQPSGATREAADKAPDEAGARQAQGTEQIREEGKKISSEAKASSLWHALPANWVPARNLSPTAQSMVENWPPGALQAELESFRAWAANAEPKKGKGLKKDWDDAFGNWIRTAHRDRYSRIVTLQRPRTNPVADLYRAVAEAESAYSEDHHRAWVALPPAGNG